MKTETGYLYEINGEVFVNPEEEPSKFLFYDDDIHLKESEYKKALKDWQANYIPVVNVMRLTQNSFVVHDDNGSRIGLINTLGQKCEYSVKNGKSTIISLI